MLKTTQLTKNKLNSLKKTIGFKERSRAEAFNSVTFFRNYLRVLSPAAKSKFSHTLLRSIIPSYSPLSLRKPTACKGHLYIFINLSI